MNYVANKGLIQSRDDTKEILATNMMSGREDASMKRHAEKSPRLKNSKLLTWRINWVLRGSNNRQLFEWAE